MILRVLCLGVVATFLSGTAATQEFETFRSAVVALVDDDAARRAFEDDLVELARSHRYDALSSYQIVPSLADFSDDDVLATLAMSGIQAVLMLRPASIGPRSSLESVRNSISPAIFTNMHAFADLLSPAGSDELIAVVHMAIYTLGDNGAELASSGAVWLDEAVESRAQGIERLEALILANVDGVRPAIRARFGLPPLPEQLP